MNFAKNSNGDPEIPAVIFIGGAVCYGRTLRTYSATRYLYWECNPYVGPFPPPNLNPTSPKQPWRRLAISMGSSMLIALHREALQAGMAALAVS